MSFCMIFASNLLSYYLFEFLFGTNTENKLVYDFVGFKTEPQTQFFILYRKITLTINITFLCV